MELGHLAHFVQVARYRNFTRAAKALRVQQPSVSRAVKLLEESLGVQLIIRKPRALSLTAAGERVLEAATRLFDEADHITKLAREASGDLRGPVQIAAAGAIASRLVPDAIAAIVTKHPEVWPMVIAGPAAMAMERIARGDLELGLFFYVGRAPKTLKVEPLIDVDFHLVVRRDRARDRATLASFIGSREIDDERARAFPTLELLRQIVPEAKIRISTNDTEAHLRMVRAGLGVSVLPRFVVADGLRSGELVDVLPTARLAFPLLVVTPARREPSQPASALLAAIADRLAIDRTTDVKRRRR
ncbi:MAG: LysR family transcriptional regulator [Kofleriaceae bacterium]